MPRWPASPPSSGCGRSARPLIAYAVFGSSRQLSVGPESTTALMTAVVVAPLAAGDPARFAVLAAALAVVVGVLCLVARLARLGLPRRPAVQARPRRVHGGDRGPHDREPAREGHRCAGGRGQRPGRDRRPSSVDWTSWTRPPRCSPPVSSVLLLIVQWRFPRAPAPLIGIVVASVAVACPVAGRPGRPARRGDPRAVARRGLPRRSGSPTSPTWWVRRSA